MNPFARPGLTISVALGFLILCGLGIWQSYRLGWKTDLNEAVAQQIESEPERLSTITTPKEYEHVTVSGRFRRDLPALVSGTHAGEPGWYVMQPFQLMENAEVQRVVLVNRGFISQADRQAGANLAPPVPRQDFSALVREYNQPNFLTGMFIAPHDLVAGEFFARQRAPLAGFFAMTGNDAFAPFYLDVREGDEVSVGLTPVTTRVEFTNNHLGYALTWFSLALALIGVYIVMLLNGARDDARQKTTQGSGSHHRAEA